jgi:hypothetical protein
MAPFRGPHQASGYAGGHDYKEVPLGLLIRLKKPITKEELPMSTKVKRNKINIKGKMVSIGIDMHKRSWHITALADGEIVLTVSMSRPTYDAFKKVLSQFTIQRQSRPDRLRSRPRRI